MFRYEINYTTFFHFIINFSHLIDDVKYFNYNSDYILTSKCVGMSYMVVLLTMVQ